MFSRYLFLPTPAPMTLHTAARLSAAPGVSLHRNALMFALRQCMHVHRGGCPCGTKRGRRPGPGVTVHCTVNVYYGCLAGFFSEKTLTQKPRKHFKKRAEKTAQSRSCDGDNAPNLSGCFPPVLRGALPPLLCWLVCRRINQLSTSAVTPPIRLTHTHTHTPTHTHTHQMRNRLHTA